MWDWGYTRPPIDTAQAHKESETQVSSCSNTNFSLSYGGGGIQSGGEVCFASVKNTAADSIKLCRNAAYLCAYITLGRVASAHVRLAIEHLHAK